MNEPQDTGADWASQIVNTIESFVTTIKSKTTEPVQKGAKAAVFALMGLGVVSVMLLVLTIGLIRLLDWFLPIWGAYLLLGGLFFLAGMLLWSKRKLRS